MNLEHWVPPIWVRHALANIVGVLLVNRVKVNNSRRLRMLVLVDEAKSLIVVGNVMLVMVLVYGAGVGSASGWTFTDRQVFDY
mmetsp:Transcript_6428/g.12463  ORF Transcript_6428/g.12463 Transcript_6428/m.12463 type:complete len:83 (-) Transcript_6428:379-627(-)